jgi:hypothetical protein
MRDQRECGRLADVLDEVAAGRFSHPDGGVTIVPAPSPRDAGVLGAEAHLIPPGR